MALYSIPGQMDGDVFWRYHTHEHAPAVLKVCCDDLAKVAINRVVDITKGDSHFFGVVETWWRNRAAMKAGLQALESELKRLLLKSKNLWPKNHPGNYHPHLPNTWVFIPCRPGPIQMNSGNITPVNMLCTVLIPLMITWNIMSSTE